MGGREGRGFRGYGKEMVENVDGGKWVCGERIDGKRLKKRKRVLIDEGGRKGRKDEGVGVDLADKEIVVRTAGEGKY
ncbi:hypothetical protein, partial [Bacillus sp. WP8]|uniref:hypothetical protein n=1 Tax=Bacillus sp. WP8 TaxID=756828 RepID=UPI0011A21990